MQPQYIPEYQMTLHRAHKARAARQAYQVTRLRSHKAANTPIVKNTRAEFLKSWKNMVELCIAEKHGAHIIKYRLPPRHTFMQIMNEVTEKHEVTYREIRSPRKQKRIVLARQEISYRCRHETLMSLHDIGNRTGGKHHTTILHGAENWQRLIDIKNGDESKSKPYDKNVNWDLVL